MGQAWWEVLVAGVVGGLGSVGLVYLLEAQLVPPMPPASQPSLPEPASGPGLFEADLPNTVEFWETVNLFTEHSRLGLWWVQDYLHKHGSWVEYVRVREREWYYERSQPDYPWWLDLDYWWWVCQWAWINYLNAAVLWLYWAGGWVWYWWTCIGVPIVLLICAAGLGYVFGWQLSRWCHPRPPAIPTAAGQYPPYPGLRALGRRIALFIPRRLTRPAVPRRLQLPRPGLGQHDSAILRPARLGLRQVNRFWRWQYTVRELLAVLYPHARRRAWVEQRGRLRPLSHAARLQLARWLAQAAIRAIQPNQPRLKRQAVTFPVSPKKKRPRLCLKKPLYPLRRLCGPTKQAA